MWVELVMPRRTLRSGQPETVPRHTTRPIPLWRRTAGECTLPSVKVAISLRRDAARPNRFPMKSWLIVAGSWPYVLFDINESDGSQPVGLTSRRSVTATFGQISQRIADSLGARGVGTRIRGSRRDGSQQSAQRRVFRQRIASMTGHSIEFLVANRNQVGDFGEHLTDMLLDQSINECSVDDVAGGKRFGDGSPAAQQLLELLGHARVASKFARDRTRAAPNGPTRSPRSRAVFRTRLYVWVATRYRGIAP